VTNLNFEERTLIGQRKYQLYCELKSPAQTHNGSQFKNEIVLVICFFLFFFCMSINCVPSVGICLTQIKIEIG